MTTDFSLPALDALYAQIEPGPWVAYSYEGESESGRHRYSLCRNVNDMTDHTCLATVKGDTEAEARALAEYIARLHNAWPQISARLKELETQRRALVHEIRRYASYMLQLTEEYAKDDIERYQRAMDRAHEMQFKSDEQARTNPEEFAANVEQVAKAAVELHK